MKPLALALAALVVGSGCIVTTDDPQGDVALYWQFRNYDGIVAGNFSSANSGCALAGVTDVTLELYRGAALEWSESAPCEEVGSGLPSAYVSRVRTGAYSYRLTAMRLGDPVFMAEGPVDVLENRLSEAFATLDVLTPAPLTLYYTQNGTFSCAGTPNLTWALYTSPSRATLVSSDGGVGTCDPYAFGFSVLSLDVGWTYYLDFMQLVDAGGISRWEKCALQIKHTGFPEVIDLAPAPAAGCPL